MERMLQGFNFHPHSSLGSIEEATHRWWHLGSKQRWCELNREQGGGELGAWRASLRLRHRFIWAGGKARGRRGINGRRWLSLKPPGFNALVTRKEKWGRHHLMGETEEEATQHLFPCSRGARRWPWRRREARTAAVACLRNKEEEGGWMGWLGH
jgi:hypothetical protein